MIRIPTSQETRLTRIHLKNKLTLIAAGALFASPNATTRGELTADITIHGDKSGSAISPTLYGQRFACPSVLLLAAWTKH